MFATIARFFQSLFLVLETSDAVIRTVNNLATTAEAHSAHFKSISTIELSTKQTKAERQAIAELAEPTA